MLYPLLLEAPLKDYLWGGNRLRDEYGKETSLDKVAESWEMSCHEAGMSVIAGGADKGKTLKQWIAEQEKDVLGTKAAAFDYFPLLIKLIDAKRDLSVQVRIRTMIMPCALKANTAKQKCGILWTASRELACFTDLRRKSVRKSLSSVLLKILCWKYVIKYRFIREMCSSSNPVRCM